MKYRFRSISWRWKRWCCRIFLAHHISKKIGVMWAKNEDFGQNQNGKLHAAYLVLKHTILKKLFKFAYCVLTMYTNDIRTIYIQWTGNSLLL